MSKITAFIYLFVIYSLLLYSCQDSPKNTKNTLESEDEKIIGYTIDTSICAYLKSKPDINILLETDYPAVYSYLYNLIENLLESHHLTQSPILRIVQSPPIYSCNAFIAPGGHIYLSSDFLKTLTSESQFAGILSTLMICQEKGHPLKKLENKFSTTYLIDLALGARIKNPSSLIHELRKEPYDSAWVRSYDSISVDILCENSYYIQAYADLFLLNNILPWIQLFPHENSFSINLLNRGNSIGCNGTIDNQIIYQSIIANLP